MVTDPIKLTYQERPRGRRVWRKIVLVCMLALALLVARWSWTPISLKAKFLYAQHRCLTHTDPPGQVVGYFNSANEIAEFTRQHPDFTIERHATFQFARRPSPDWDRLIVFLNGFAPGQFSAFTLPPLYRFAPGETMAFMHERTNHAGNGRLVSIHLTTDQNVGAPIWVLTPNVIDPKNSATLTLPKFQGGAEIASFPRGGQGIAERKQSTPHSMVFYAGTISPDDLSRFSIPYAMDDQAGTIECRLKDDDTVEFTVSGPARERSATILGGDEWMY